MAVLLGTWSVVSPPRAFGQNARADTTGTREVGPRAPRPDSLALRRPTVLGAFAAGARVRRDPAAVAELVAQRLARRLEGARRALWQRTVARDLGVAVADEAVTETVARARAQAIADSIVAAAEAADSVLAALAADDNPLSRLPAPLLAGIGDLGLNLSARLESKLTRSKNELCTAAQLTQVGSNCFATFLPSFDFQFNMGTSGVVAERVFVNVDYDSQREFDASNNISVYYQGKSDELLERLEVGNVTLQAPGSRLITGGIPANNYGIQATGQFGPMRYTGIVAQQRGNVSKGNVYTIGERSLQQVSRVIEDISMEPRRFFWTIDPRQLPGYPNIDILNRQALQQAAAALPDSIRPVRVYLYRQLIGATNQNPNGPQFSVRGARNPSRQIYEVLRENVDYYVDPSGLWVVLVRPVQPNDERLVVAYEVSVGGQPGRNPNTGGTPDIEFTAAPQFANLLWEPELQPDNPAYFTREIKSVYRLGGDEVRRETVSLRLVTGTSGDQEKPVDASRGQTYLQMYGLSQATNPAVFDVENRLWPRPNDPNTNSALPDQKLIRDYFVVFPSLQPFAREGLAQPLANPANDTLYTYPNEYLYSTQRPQAIYRILAQYEAEGGADAGSINLGAQQLRPGSERIELDGIQLVRDRDYTVDYELGRVDFLRPDTLFPRPRQVSVRYEENPLFAAAPVSILGFAGRFPLERGEVTFTAISQQQRSTFNRPPLGYEPVGSLVAGVTGDFGWDAPLLSRFLSRYGLSEETTPSRVAFQGEFALSRPQPNAAGQAYIESFEGDAGTQIALQDAAWGFSSIPQRGESLAARFGLNPFELSRATTLAYQSTGVNRFAQIVQFTIDQIDPSVNLVGGGIQPPEPVLFLSLYPQQVGGGGFRFDIESNSRIFNWNVGPFTSLGMRPSGVRWRSLRTTLNPSGSDLSRVENLEFYALVFTDPGREPLNPTLVLDFGDISENTVSIAPDTMIIRRRGTVIDTVFTGKRVVGLDRLDTERDRFSRAFNVVENDVGIPGDKVDTLLVIDSTAAIPTAELRTDVPTCSGTVQLLQILGDSRVNCTVRNNRLDEEDIDLDGALNMTLATAPNNERFKRFVVDLSDRRGWTRLGACQRVATEGGTASDSLQRCWVQVRLNWRAPTDSLGTPNDRRVRALRLSMLSHPQAPDTAFVGTVLARMRLVGSPWLKRTERPISGIAGDSTGTLSGGYVIASVIGTLDSSANLSYQPPPGVVEQPDRVQTGLENTNIQVNEQGLRLLAGGAPGETFRAFDRAEAFLRFPEGLKTFMGYRTLRLWMRGRGNGWGPDGELQGFVKIGRDEHNFYLYRTPVNTGVTQNAWEPEVRVDLQRFQALRAQLENAFQQGSADSLACTDADLALIERSGLPRGSLVRRYAACSDGYMVYTTDPAVTPPNLAGVQELAVGLVRIDSVPRGANAIMPGDTLELWINDIRLTDVVDDMGFAGTVGVAFNAGDLADVRASVSRTDPNFRQLGEDPSFLTQSGVSVGTTLHLERLLPRRLGFVMPLSVDYTGSGVRQTFINRTDIRAGGLDGLREPGGGRTNYSLSFRRLAPMDDGWYAPLLNGLALNANWSSGSSQTAFQEGRQRNYAINATLDLTGAPREAPLPGFLTGIIARLPGFLGGDTEFARSLREGAFRWNPSLLRVTSGLARQQSTITSFLQPVASARDTGQQTEALNHVWQNQATLELRPSAGLTARVDARQVLDLRDYGSAGATPDSADRRIAAAAERLSLFGADIGLERERSITTAFSLTPLLTPWLRPRLDYTSSFNFGKDANARALLRENGESGAFRLPTRLGALQTLNVGTTLDVGRLADTWEDGSWARRLLQAVQPFDVLWSRTLSSNYDNTTLRPALGYQFGFGGLDLFRGTDSRLASAAGRSRRATANGGLTLPLGFGVVSRFEDAVTQSWTRRPLSNLQALITTTQRVLPDLTLRWSWRPFNPIGPFAGVTSSAQYAVNEQIVTAPNESGGFADRSRARATRLPFSLGVAWDLFGPLATNATFTRTEREDVRPGALTLSSSEDMSFALSRSFPIPRSWKQDGGTVRAQVSYQQQLNRSIVTSEASVTNPDPAQSVLTDNGRQAINFNADTELSSTLSFSITGSHIIAFDRNFNRRTSQTVLSTMLTLNFFGGAR